MITSRSSARRLSSSVFWLTAAALTGIFILAQPAVIVSLLLIFSAVHPLAAAAVMLILAPMRALIETESAFRLPLDIGQLTILLLGFSWITHRVVWNQRLFLPLWTPLYVPLAIFIAVGGLTGFTALSAGAWLNEWLKWMIIALLVMLILILRHPEWLVFTLITAGIANALVGLYIFFGGSGALHLLINDRFFRAFGTFGQPNPFGGFMGLLAPLAATAALGYALQFWRHCRLKSPQYDALILTGFYSAAFGLLSVGVVISWSRGAWLAFAAALLVVIVSIPRKLWQSLCILIGILAVFGLLWSSGRLPGAVIERINSATQEIFAFDDVRGVDITPENYAVVERLAHWQAALNMARSNFWLGVGLGNYEVAYTDYQLINWEEPLGHAHNYYLNVLAETGIIGAVAYCGLWGYIFFMTWRARSHPDPLSRLMASGLLGTWTYLCVHSLTDNLYVNNLFLHIGVMIGLAALLYYQTCQGLKLKSR